MFQNGELLQLGTFVLQETQDHNTGTRLTLVVDNNNTIPAQGCIIRELRMLTYQLTGNIKAEFRSKKKGKQSVISIRFKS